MGKRRRYSQAFKEDAVRRMRARGTRTVTDIAAELDVSSSLLHRWNQAIAPNDGPSGRHSASESEEVEALRRRLRQAEMENALLKKAAALFAKDVK